MREVVEIIGFWEGAKLKRGVGANCEEAEEGGCIGRD